ncbi:peptidylprolyl isomerase [Nonlabens sp. MIC269]|uniref:FKBP-type peptidyl-prolyl cis-trans isomerase n=1 Tax=Nonlabens sp. MIC269 TaxID=1476901 RepID=UPI000721C892|nr:peptidylprolyl isomerase [Nonlabens sp. MIC269]ALM21948.1 peptidylprolyl isomerase [Nonlabens sp. MIC269]
MMKKLLRLGLLAGFVLAVFACNNDDDDAGIQIRDRDEVDLEDQAALLDYLQTHYYNEDDFVASPTNDVDIILREIDDPTTQTPLINQVETRTIEREGVNYTYYLLKLREGNLSDPQITYADSALVSYEGRLLDNTLFDAAQNPIWFDLPRSIEGFARAAQEFKGSQSVTANPDGTITFDGSGIGAVFMPSGIAYFNSSPTGIPAYSPLLFTFKVHAVKINDHDNDGILSRYEDPNNDELITTTNDDTDSDRIANFEDRDDDGDGVGTIFENADPNGDGNPDDAEDLDGDGIPGYLDADEVNIDLDGDGIQNRFENPDPDGNFLPGDAVDTDGDGVPDYLDPDDDGDGIPTSQENADPDGNTNPDDARDSDGDGIPDYLDADS